MLLAKGADVKLLDLENDASALSWAAFYGRPQVVGGSQGRWQRFSSATLDDWRRCAELIRAQGGVE